MAYANVQSSGLVATTSGGNLSWTPTAPTLNNLLTLRAWSATTQYSYGASDTKDSSGTPKTFTQDVVFKDATSHRQASIYSLVVPSGLTTPLLQVSANGTSGTNQCVFDEWSGNATSSVFGNGNTETFAAATSRTGVSLTTGANVGIVFAIVSIGGSTSNDGLTTTGTSFTQDAAEQDGATNDTGGADHRTASVASTTLNDSWTWTPSLSGVDIIASYNAPVASGVVGELKGPMQNTPGLIVSTSVRQALPW